MESKGKRPTFHIAWGQKSIVSLCTKYTPPHLLIWSQERSYTWYNHLRFIGPGEQWDAAFFSVFFFFLCCFYYTLAKKLKKNQNLPKTQKPHTRRPLNTTNFLLDIFFNIILNMQRIFSGRIKTWHLISSDVDRIFCAGLCPQLGMCLAAR